jgi:Family of unknown function (DUF6111)
MSGAYAQRLLHCPVVHVLFSLASVFLESLLGIEDGPWRPMCAARAEGAMEASWTVFNPAAVHEPPPARGGLTLFGPFPRAMADSDRRHPPGSPEALPFIASQFSSRSTRKPTHHITACARMMGVLEHGRYSNTIESVAKHNSSKRCRGWQTAAVPCDALWRVEHLGHDRGYFAQSLRKALFLMWRAILEPALLFASPFAAYTIYLVLRRNYPFAMEHWTKSAVSTLTLVGLAIAITGMIAFGIFAPRHKGAYVPAHIENGKLVPGRLQ